MNHNDNKRRMILPSEVMQEQLIQQQMQQARVDMHGQPIPTPIPKGPKIPFLQIPVIDDACFLLYAIGKHALDSKDFEQFPIILARIQEMHDGLLVLYERFGVKETDYRKFCVTPEEQGSKEEDEQGSNGAGEQGGVALESNGAEEQEGGEGSELIRQSEEDT